MKLEAVLFDFDGTLVDSEPNWWESDRRFVETFGGVYDEALRNECIGIGSLTFAKLIKDRLNLNQPLDELMRLKDRLYREAATGKSRPFPEMLKLIEAFRLQKLPMAVASGSSLPILSFVMGQAGLEGLFGPHVYSSDQVAQPKPAPDVFLHAAERLGVAPRNCLVFEDSRHGVEAGKAAGMKVCAIPQVWTETGRLSFQKADLLFRGGMAEFTAEAVLDWIDATYCLCADCTLYDLGRCAD